MYRHKIFIFTVASLTLIISCTKNDLQFGTDLGQTFTNLQRVDTLGIQFSTYALDSFATSSDSSFLVGRYSDPLLGLISAKPFLEFNDPGDHTLAADAVYDSLALIIKPNGYYYGDTSRKMNLVIRELNQPIQYTYASRLYNTSTISENVNPLGTKLFKFSPTRDTIAVRLDDAKGREFFDYMMNDAAEFKSSDAFSAYFKGISIGFQLGDTSAIYGFKATADNIYMRLYYHTTIPYPASDYKDFPYSTGLPYFTQLISDRKGGLLAGTLNGEVSSTRTNHLAVSQATTGLFVKMTFPSLRSLLQVDTTLRLLKANLVLRIAKNTYDPYKIKVPSNLYLLQTDATNTPGSAVGYSATPQLDYLYGSQAYYSFDVTSFINILLTTSGSQNTGLFLLENSPGSLAEIDRVAINDSQLSADARSELILTVLTIKN